MASPSSILHHPWVARAGTVLWIGILGFAVWALTRLWAELSFQDLLAALGKIGPAHIALAACCTAISYLCNSSLDIFALRSSGVKTPWPTVLRTAFVAMTFSMNAGGAMIGGGSVRLRSYKAAGLSGLQIASVMLFVAIVAWSGYCLNAGIHLLLSPAPIKDVPHELSSRFAGPVLILVAILIAAGFIGWRLGGAKLWPFSKLPPIRRKLQEQAEAEARGEEVLPPASRQPLRLALVPAAPLASACDWLFARLALWSLLPEISGIHISTFLATVALSQCVAAISHVPGGAGVLELMLTSLLAGTVGTASLAGALLIFRVIHYLLPFALAAFLLILWEIGQRRQRTKDEPTAAAHS